MRLFSSRLVDEVSEEVMLPTKYIARKYCTYNYMTLHVVIALIISTIDIVLFQYVLVLSE